MPKKKEKKKKKKFFPYNFPSKSFFFFFFKKESFNLLRWIFLLVSLLFYLFIIEKWYNYLNDSFFRIALVHLVPRVLATPSACLESTESCGAFFFRVLPFFIFFGFSRNIWLSLPWTVHKFHFSATFLLKMGLMILFTHLKIILLQYFQFQFSISATISSI